MDFEKKYRHVGYSYPSVPNSWQPIVKKAIIDIEKIMWPKWMPMFLKRLIHYLATDNSVVRIKYHWAYKLKNYFTNGQMISDIKTKYAGLRIYYYGGNLIRDIVKKAEIECENTCENCGSQEQVKIVGPGWYENLCINCQMEKENKINAKRTVLIEKHEK